MTISQVRRQCLDKRTHSCHDISSSAFVVRPDAWRPLMPRPFGSRIALSPDAQQQLETLVRAGSTPQSLAFRCRLILLAAAGNPTNQQLAQRLECDRHTVGQWRERFVAQGLAGLQDAPRSGRPRSFSPDEQLHVLNLASSRTDDHDQPATRWTLDELAATIVNE